ncbi:MAG: carboxypeptidase-like regulatory domain-containing protein [Actinomycetota bacterium]|nr:carboxypeptidase-like regulatory domain-containing protein [Actinomycetota bacterium]
MEGVRIAVADPAGAAVGEDRTDGEGSWQVPLPAPGAYRVTIDEQSLPEG